MMTEKVTIESNLIRNAIDVFVRSGLKNSWLQIGPMQVYVRKGQHYFYGPSREVGERIVGTFDVANVMVEESERGKGWFTSFLNFVEAYMDNVYVENVLEPRLRPFLQKRGYREFNGMSYLREKNVSKAS
jgi:hypothetical protein